jgi:hypothetical protein
MRKLLAVIVGVTWLARTACAETPAAIVEDVRGKVEGIEFMDYVAPGKIIKLGPNATIVLGYLASCWRETISGGVVQVGREQSSVQLGDVQRIKVPCDAKAALLSEHEAGQGAATTFRTVRSDTGPASTKPPPTLYGLSPLIEAEGGGVLTIERVDAKEPPLSVPLNASIRVRGKFYDLGKAGKTLTPGGSYVASMGARHVTFQVDKTATASATPIVGRLLRLN